MGKGLLMTFKSEHWGHTMFILLGFYYLNFDFACVQYYFIFNCIVLGAAVRVDKNVHSCIRKIFQ